MELRGRWRKLSEEPCSDLYPAEITFDEATYLATKGREQAFLIWDAGIYRLEEGQALISIATDELVPYGYKLEAERVTFTDPEGCEFSYERLAG